MTLHIMHDPENQVVQILADAVSEDLVADLAVEVGPGQSAFGRGYEFWALLPEGPFELDGFSMPLPGPSSP